MPVIGLIDAGELPGSGKNVKVSIWGAHVPLVCLPNPGRCFDAALKALVHQPAKPVRSGIYSVELGHKRSKFQSQGHELQYGQM